MLDQLESKTELVNCSIVCQNWQLPSQIQFYKHISFENSNEALVMMLLTSTYQPGSFVRSLLINPDIIDQELLLEVLNMMPFTQHIVFSQ
jgi:hypothetical protein